ncbi:uncharacterized protein LOC119769292 [Culex quinquefasciatus]|uniref:uncharacterized protein LOC119769292 n=2 Tax=Culex pipiens complex TaxID=518105 RepID=UPI0018E3F41A|nr:uncharacterized protein LOC119769292 [Culex quinquefasciatus]
MFYPGWKTQFLPANIIGNLDYKSTDTVLGYQADLTFKSEQPIFKKAYQVPYKIKDKFNEHLDMLERQGVITPIKASEWASPVIAIVKKDGDLRMIQIGRHVATAHRHQLKALHVPKRGSVKMCFAANSYKRNFSSIDDDGGLLGHSRDYAVYRKQRKVDNESRSPVRTRSRARLENQQGHN